MKYILQLLAVILLFASCTGMGRAPDDNEEMGNGIYYWKTVFKLSEWDREFLKRYQVRRLYIRLFDVDYNFDYYGEQRSVPIATTRFDDILPDDMEIIPVVYITQSAIKNDTSISHLLYKRILAMGKRNNFGNIHEIQLDCDWTKTTRENFFSLCRRLREIGKPDGISISATIRLHQLKDKVPPVDRGVLMLYNTGSLYNSRTENSILNYKDIEPYLKTKTDYDLALSYAYPTYRWGILMRNNEFQAILHNSDFSDSTLYKPCGNNLYEVLRKHYWGHNVLEKGDNIRLECSEIDEIQKVKQLVLSKIGKPQSTIIYHLDSLNLLQYKENEITRIF